MKRLRILLLVFAALAVLVAVVQHVRSGQARTEFERERLQLLAATQRAQAAHVETKRQLEASRARASAQAAKTAARAEPPVAAAADAHAAAAQAARLSGALAPSDPEMRRVRVQTFVGEQRMQFAALLHRIGFTPAQRQAFDRINEEYYEAMLDEKLAASGRDVARGVRAEALRALFGTQHDTWREANQQAFARGIVDGIIHQTFPSSGALNAAQADELTRLVAQHRLPASGASSPASFDWDRIIDEARTLLADRQMEDFIAAVSHRRASDQMSAMAAQAKR
jgi:hypothetical protein